MASSGSLIRPTPARRVAAAFLRIAFARALSYPMSLIMNEMTAMIPMFIYFFVARLVANNSPTVGGDYFTFVVIGIVVQHVLGASLKGFTTELEQAINQGRFEILLVEPVHDRAIPLGLIEWPLALRCVGAIIVIAASLLLGARYAPSGAAYAVLLLFLGVLATLAIGIVAGSIRVLAKQEDPVITLYSFGVLVLSGVFFPVQTLPPLLRGLSYLIPHTYVLEAVRKVLMPGGSTIPGLSPRWATFGLVLFAAIVMPFSFWLWGRALRLGRKLGALGGY